MKNTRNTVSVKIKTRKGIASIYVVIMSSLLFGVITAGFIVLMVHEVSKSTENALSQSAYDSSLVGIEDAKRAIRKYYECAENDESDECKIIRKHMLNISKSSDCLEQLRSISGILRGIEDVDSIDITNGILVQENIADDSDVTQAYTCVDINLNPTDYLATLTQSSPQRTIPLHSKTADLNNIETVRISWYSTSNLGTSNTNFANIDSTTLEPIFGSKTNTSSNPPVLSVQIYQTSDDTSLDDFSDKTANATMWLVPSNTDTLKKYTYQYGLGTTKLGITEFENSGNHEDSNVVHSAYPVRCAQNNTEITSLGSNYLCVAEIQIPQPQDENGNPTSRSSEYGSFLLSLSLPYQYPDTDIKVEMLDKGGQLLEYDQVQIEIDSTGRANDIYARTASRVEFYDSSFPFPDYALTLDSSDNGTGLQKTFSVSGANSKCWSYNAGNANNTVDDCKN